VASDSFEDVEFDILVRVVALEEVPVGHLPGALDEALRIPERETVDGDAPDGNNVDPSGDMVNTGEA
jgi:hypothetical protein